MACERQDQDAKCFIARGRSLICQKGFALNGLDRVTAALLTSPTYYEQGVNSYDLNPVKVRGQTQLALEFRREPLV